MRKLIVAATLVLMSTPALAAAPAPKWCGRNSLSEAEFVICDNRTLWQMDHDMREQYDSLVRISKGKAVLKIVAQQRNWLAKRNACRENYHCLLKSYENRIGHLEGLVEVQTELNDTE